MQPKKQISSPQLDMFRSRLESILNHGHELYRLSGLIDWEVFESEFGKLYEEGRPGIPIRLLVGLTYLSHAFNTPDEETVRRWVENPYHQYFCGEEYFRHELPIDPSSLSRWRKRIGEEGAELILKLTVQAGLATGAVAPTSLERVIVDTTVQEKAVAYPTDSRLYNRSRERLVKLAAVWGIRLRQSYSRLGRQALMKVGRYLHARQRRSAVEPVIGHMKADGKLGRNYLLGELGDKINALLCGAGHNIRLILKKLREKLLLFFAGVPAPAN